MRDWKDYLRTQEIKVVKIETIKPFENNPRLNKKAVPAVAASIKRFGFRNPILVDAEGVIIEGHTRRLAALELGMKEVPVVYVTDLTQDEVDALRVIDNKTAELADWDMDKLADEMMRLPDFNFGDFGFDLSTFTDSEEIKGKTDDDYVPEIEESQEPISKRGEVYLLGDHRLMCGDSTSADDVARLMNGEKADMVFTDPPYNVAFNGRSGNFDVIKNDNLSEQDFANFIDETINTIKFINAPIYYIWCNWNFYGILQNKLDYKSCIVWAKNVFGLGKGYRHQHEFCLFNGKIDEDITNESDLWEIAKDTNYVHPTQKPIALCARALKNHKKVVNVLDIFGGSGSTLIACEQLRRKCRAMELDEHYCDVIRKRWAEYVHGEGCDWVSLTPKEN